MGIANKPLAIVMIVLGEITKKLEVFIPIMEMRLCRYVDTARVFIPKREIWLCGYAGMMQVFIPKRGIRRSRYDRIIQTFIPIEEKWLCRYVDTA